ncbi:actin-like ATPase domain-containing protein [Purpureocillium lavendulum]|uniref:Actin-like ATPase domain-containing protein n=1 Tax=Purpureocillium lavendulum TaxID=1247861 RepID=A0AB34G344_9HYPO|nr:actin-like ATPase domain-containing protein [Purpureocillium lavendulum]
MGSDKITEILYEPDVPWFKIITERVFEQQVTQFIQQQLLAIVAQDAGLFDPQQRRHEEASHTAFADVTVVGDNPRVLPWSHLENEVDSPRHSFAAHQFPLDIGHLSYQEIWRGLEAKPGSSFPWFFQMLEAHWLDAGAPTSIAGLEALTRCQVTHNLAGNLAYLGTDESQEALDEAICILDNLFFIAAEVECGPEHLLVTEGNNTFRFVLKWLTHICQERTTFVQDTIGARLQVAVRVRAERMKRGIWVQDETPLVTRNRYQGGKVEDFAPFRDISYAKKHPTAVQELLRKLQENPTATKSYQSPRTDACEDVDKSSIQYIAKSPSKTTVATRDHSSQVAVETWRADVCRNSQDPVEQSRGPAGSSSQLIQVDEPHEKENTSRPSKTGTASGSTLNEFGSVRQDANQQDILDQPDQTEDLICFDNEDLNTNLPENDEKDLLDFQELPMREARTDPGPPDPFAVLGCPLLEEGNKDDLRLPVLVPSVQEPKVKTESHGNAPLKAVLPTETYASMARQGSDTANPVKAGPSSQKPRGTVAPDSSNQKLPRIAREKSKILQLAESRVKGLAAILQLMPGFISIDLHFGRVYLSDLGSHLVNVGSGPVFSASDLIGILNDMKTASLGFSATLSTYGADMNDVVHSRPGGPESWQLVGTRVVYDFYCRDDSGKEFVVEIDSNTFQFSCRGLKEELNKLFLHCVSRAWDMQVCTSQATNLDTSSRHRTIGDTIVASICVKSVDDDVALEAIADERLSTKVRDVQIRHMATYRQGAHGESELSVTMVKKMSPRQRRENRTTWVVGSQSHPVTSYEASIKSLRAEDLFMENRAMCIGQRASWDCDILEEAGVFEAICRPALGMIASLDDQAVMPCITTTVLLLVAAAVTVHLVRLNYVMTRTPREARAHALQERLTAERIWETYERVRTRGVDWRGSLPQRKERRYIIVGGSGLVGGQLALDLLQMGVPPAAIRLVDIRRPARAEFSSSGPASDLSFVNADVTSESGIFQAFDDPWDDDVADLPLTVFHTVALIRPFEREQVFYERCSRVNVAGTANVLAAARRAGAGIFIYTSSCHAALRSTGWFLPPWARQPRDFVQFLGEDDFFRPLPQPRDFASNYARSKAEAERLVCGADNDDGGSRKGTMRTAAIRPGNGVYGHKDDTIVGRIMNLGRVPTYSAPWVHNWVNVRNVTQGHLRLEDAMLGEHADKVAGRPFMVSDEGPGLQFQDVYDILSTTSSTGMRIDHPPPILLLLVAYGIEAYCLLLEKLPLLKRVLREAQEPLVLFQPALFSSSVTAIIDDSAARRVPAEGGLGYAPSCTTLEGMCLQVVHWNQWIEEQRQGGAK